ncbi:MAG: AAA family ATPase, partial [Caldisericaceae bacterium]
MYLEEIELFGFKTFVSNTKIILSKSITAIVGPNGSGKSNVVDAMRWILGETKFTLLRATESSDLIFSGSSTKSPLNVASVKMIFNNEDHKLPIKTPRFVIERRIYRSKESHYYVNGEESSLQNVLSIFNAGGIFGANFAIVGQGRVEEILLARPEEKKGILDKVAGIESFKKRRDEALKRLQETDENLVRVYDRLSELRREAERIVNEAKKAHLYYMLVDKLKALEATYYSSKITTLSEEIELIKMGLESFNSEYREITKLISDKKQHFEEVHSSLLAATQQYELTKQKTNENRIEVARLIEKQNAIRDKIKMLQGKNEENKLRIEKLQRTM